MGRKSAAKETTSSCMRQACHGEVATFGYGTSGQPCRCKICRLRYSTKMLHYEDAHCIERVPHCFAISIIADPMQPSTQRACPLPLRGDRLTTEDHLAQALPQASTPSHRRSNHEGLLPTIGMTQDVDRLRARSHRLESWTRRRRPHTIPLQRQTTTVSISQPNCNPTG